MSFASALDQLDALGLELSPTVPRRKFDLDHMRTLARALGDPQTRFPSVLIAGTNGKGSTAATLASILTAAGYSTGLYTSPHLSRITERIRVSGREQGAGIRDQVAEISEQRSKTCFLFPVPCSLLPVPCLTEIPEPAFARLYFRVDDAARALVLSGQLPHHPSYFETLTALAFLYFAECNLDIAVLEVGLGGRLDATNIVSPLLSVITDIALDHQDYLGPTISAIAREKAGILRPNGTLITLPQHPEANQAIGEAAIALNVHAISATPYLPFRGIDSGAPCQTALSSDVGLQQPLPPNRYTLHLSNQPLHVHSPLAGEHQRRNIALAIAAAFELRNHFDHNSAPAPAIRNQTDYTSTTLAPSTKYRVPIEAIELGIAATSWPGRLEFLPPNLLLDVAHNPAGAWTLRAAIATLPESVTQGFSLGSPRTLIFSCLRDKDLAEMAQILFPLFDSSSDRPHDHIILAPIASPRAASLESLQAAAARLSIPAHSAAGPAEALALARSLTPAGGLILATGSVYLIGALRSLAT
jgi:dihydrofolate synthase/folylpolyglutamate synthase